MEIIYISREIKHWCKFSITCTSITDKEPIGLLRGGILFDSLLFLKLITVYNIMEQFVCFEKISSSK